MAVERLYRRPAAPAELLIRGARVLDPRTAIDGAHDVLVRNGEIAELGAPGSLEAPEGAELVEGAGRHLFPGFVDPHVHLRTPGEEHKETLESGTRAAAAGGFVAIVAMPTPRRRSTTPRCWAPCARRRAARPACRPASWRP
jgi:dihydroorotase